MRRASGPERALAALLALGLLLGAGEALARVGGGQGYSGGGGGGGGGYSGGGGGGSGDGGAIIELLIWLVIHHPAIGVPVTIFLIGVVLYSKLGAADRQIRTHGPTPGPMGPPPVARPQRQAILALDPNFSEPLFIDYVQLVYARAQRARGDGQTAALRPLATPAAIQSLLALRGGAEEVRDIIVGSTNLVGMRRQGGRLTLLVDIEVNLTEVRAGKEVQLLRRERLNFGRHEGVLSPGPEAMRSLGCPSCGSTQEITVAGTCPNCGIVRTGGLHQWELEALQVVENRPLSPPELHLGGGIEPGTRLRTVVDPNLAVQVRALTTRHPGFSWEAFNQTAERIFLKLQEAWSTQRWELARPYQTDALFQTHRFWMERYRRFGLVNRVENVAVRRIELARVDVDAYYESITLRIFASMLDWTEQARDGKLVAGSRDEPRVMSEYWTFIRRIGGPARPDGAGFDAERCPSCGAPLDRVSPSGVCGYCEAKITTGDFDWVLTRIEQDEAYRG